MGLIARRWVFLFDAMLHPDQFDVLTTIGQLKAIPKLQPV
jgi:hypothetical protein